ncbi:hypothetical protein EDD21DRAFT_401122 [Dissophora ornata]|nr:hypothetical protein BGZ58_000978 [Dissophora ornata]KAI8605582.1 hypothetical protein EDD21DRAFT_401122 [Dissophora ornata]
MAHISSISNSGTACTTCTSTTAQTDIANALCLRPRSRRGPRQRTLLVSVLSALALTLVIGSSNEPLSGTLSVANALPHSLAQINIPVAIATDDVSQEDQRVLDSHSSVSVTHIRDDQREQDTDDALRYVKASASADSGRRRLRDPHAYRQNRPDSEKVEEGQTEVYRFQRRFLVLASRVSGKSIGQVEQIAQKYSEVLEKEADVHLLQQQQEETNTNFKRLKPSDSNGSSGESQTSIVGYAWVPTRGHRGHSVYDEDGKLRSAGVQVLEDGPVGYKRVPKKTPAIFYVPHQDDDALAMALSIREHVESGRKVIVHLYSDGINALLRDLVAGDKACSVPHKAHQYNLTLDDEVTGRTHEFRNSLKAMGVSDENIFETGWSDVEPYTDYDAFKEKLKHLIARYEAKYPGASHKCISGEYDRDGSGRNPTHRACWDAATDLLDEHPRGLPTSRQLWDFRFYRTYTFYKPPDLRSAQYIKTLPKFLKFKQQALDQYKRLEPEDGELAWGYHSVQVLIDASYTDPHLYIDMLDTDPLNPQTWLPKGQRAGERGQGILGGVHLEQTVNGTEILVVYQQQQQKLQQAGSPTAVDPGVDAGGEAWSESEIANRQAFVASLEAAFKKPNGEGYGNHLPRFKR